MSDWKVTRLAGALGAEITGFNLAGASGQDINSVKALLLEHKVIFFPGQEIDIEEQESTYNC